LLRGNQTYYLMRKLLLIFSFFLFIENGTNAQSINEPEYLAKISENLHSPQLEQQYIANVNLVQYWNFRDDKKGLFFAENALKIAQNLQNPVQIATAQILIAREKIGLYQYQEANDLLWQVVDKFQNANDSILAEAQFNLAENADFLEHIDNKIPFAQKAYRSALQCGHQGIIAKTAAELSFFYNISGDIPNAIIYQKEAEKFLALAGDRYPTHQNQAYAALEITAMDAEDYETARRYCLRQLDLCKSTYSIRYATFANTGLGFIHNAKEEFEKAIPYFEKNIEILQTIGKKGDLGSNLGYIGSSLVGLNQPEKAIPYQRKAVEIAREEGFNDHVVSSSRMLAGNLVKIGKFDEAQKYYQDAITLSSRLHLGVFHEVALEYSQLLQKQGKHQAAFSMYQSAILARDTIINLENEKKIKAIELKSQSEHYETQVQGLHLNLKNQKNLLAVTTFTLFLLGIIAFLFFRQNQLKQKTQLALNQLKIQEIRNNIAADLHDEIGSTLTNIEMLGVIGQRLRTGEEAQSLFQKISNEAKATNDAIHNIVWSVNPENDKLDNILYRIQQTAIETLESQNIKLHLGSDGINENIVLIPEKRRDLLLVFKEILTNILKHADASEVSIKLFVKKNMLHFEINDNGKGMTCTEAKHGGNGLCNIRQRIEKWQGKTVIENKNGLNIAIELPIG
jgi:two-component system, NarL family, sensor histidine kinase UhpB